MAAQIQSHRLSHIQVKSFHQTILSFREGLIITPIFYLNLDLYVAEPYVMITKKEYE